MTPTSLARLVIELTSACNLACANCYSRAVSQTAEGGWTADGIKGVIAQATQMGCRFLVLSGGEPLLVLDTVLAGAAAGAGYGMDVTLTTNGTRLTATMARRLAEAGVSRIQVSLDGWCAERHERRRGAGTFAKALRATAIAREAGLEVAVMTVPEWGDVHNLHKFPPLLADIGVELWGVERPIAYGDAAGGGYHFDSSRLRALHDELLEIEAAWPNLRVHCNDPIYGVRRMTAKLRDPSVVAEFADELAIGCAAGRRALALGGDGSVRPCTFLDCRTGNIADTPLRDLWDEAIRAVAPATEPGACGDCLFTALCGGCPAHTLASTGAIAGRDPACYLFVDKAAS